MAHFAIFPLFLVLPFPSSGTGETVLRPEEVSRQVDSYFDSVWEREGIRASKASSDAEFLRRVSLDITGVIPKPDAVLEFLRSRDRDKRTKKIDELLADPYYVRHWARIWENLIVGRDGQRRFQAIYRTASRPWLKNVFEKNMPYDDFVRELITAKGSTADNGATVFVSKWGDTVANVTGRTASLFMGVRVQCAECHDHPFEDISQEDFWGMAAFFSQARRRPIRNDAKPPRPIAMRVYDRKRGDVFIPDTKQKVVPKFLHGTAPVADRYGNRREMLANWILSPDSRYFARALVNRMWGHFFGSAFVNPVDDFNATNLPSHPEVLALLAEDFRQNGYDLKRLIRVMVNTDVYQQASAFSRNNAEDHRHYSRSLMRPMSPEQLFYSLMRVTNYEETMEKVARKQEARMHRRMKEGGVPDNIRDNVTFIDRVLERFTTVFENDEMGEAVDFTSTITQALFLMNGNMSNDMLQGNRGVVAGFLGPVFNPFTVRDPSKTPENLYPKGGLDDKRFSRRMLLLKKAEKEFAKSRGGAATEAYHEVHEKAGRMMTTKLAKAFDLSQEKASLRNTYGQNRFGQGCLLARRLVETGVKFVEVNLGGWDNHQKIFETIGEKSGQLDSGMATLVAELQQRRMLDETLVICMGDFGRTPKINANAGRDHYPRAWSMALAGGGVKGGQVIGSTDDRGFNVSERPVKAADLMASVSHAFGINPGKKRITPAGRPITIVDKEGEVVKELFS